MSYVIPIDSLSLASQERLRFGAEIQVKKRLARKLAIPEAQALDLENPAVIVRDADYVTDFVPVATQAGLAGWLTMPLAAAATFYAVFANNVPAALTPTVLNNQAVIFYGVDLLFNTDELTQLIFGVGQANNRRAQFDLEGLYSRMASSGFFSQPVAYDPQEIVNVQVRSRILTGAGARIRLATLIAEPTQQTVI